MEQKKIILCDTNVIIEFYRNNQEVIAQLMSIGQNNIAISIITSGELIFGAINKRELHQIKKDIGSLIQIDIDHGICVQFLKLMERYSLSHRISLPDAMIAATSIENNFELFTLNKKDFQFIDGLQLYR